MKLTMGFFLVCNSDKINFLYVFDSFEKIWAFRDVHLKLPTQPNIFSSHKISRYSLQRNFRNISIQEHHKHTHINLLKAKKTFGQLFYVIINKIGLLLYLKLAIMLITLEANFV